jgi:hypothetical protein
LLGNSGSTSFQVSNYEVYKVVFEWKKKYFYLQNIN